MILQVLMAMIAGWINRHQQQVIAYLLEENRTFCAKLGDRRIRFTDDERRRLAALTFPLGRKHLKSRYETPSLAATESKFECPLRALYSLDQRGSAGPGLSITRNNEEVEFDG